MPRRLPIILLLLLGALVAAPAPSRADPADPADRHERRGKQLYAEQDYEAALEAFYAAYQLRPSPGLLFLMAETHRRLRQGRQALETYRQYLSAAPRLSSARRAHVERSMAEARAMILLEPMSRPPPLRPPPPPPLYRRTWLWTLVSAAAAGAVGIAVGISTRPDLRDHPNYREANF